ncbi:ADAMTS-like protein 5 isoform X7 [Cavia porcellus]|uniref:ADAMTS-like protein 5 isoform X7 n=1 Tax=Cavia porcellus TaxID=10141 RepID=UPI002FE17B00
MTSACHQAGLKLVIWKPRAGRRSLGGWRSPPLRAASSRGRLRAARSGTAHQEPCPSETFNVPSTMAALSWAPRKPTNGYPSMGSAGCDGVLGSGALEDRCGRCGGTNDTCLFVQRVFRDAGAFAGYWNVTLIPVGARHIRVVQRSRNHLALMGGDGRYVLNGNWAVSPPGTYEAAGTQVVYTRAAGLEETLQAAGPTTRDLLLQVLLREPNPGVQFEFWLPRERYAPFQAQAQVLGWALRQPQPREVEPLPAQSLEASAARSPTRAPEPCPPCPDTRGRAHRLLHYCGSDFVFQARVLGSHRQAQEIRYEVRILLIYKNRSPLRTREYVWAAGPCPCPPLAPHREYLLAVRRLVSPDGTQDRLLLPHAGYARPWSPAEDSRARLVARRCPV